MNPTAKYFIAETFRITGRGLVFAGYVKEGDIYPGDVIEFAAFNLKRQRTILGVEGVYSSKPGKINTGLLIRCIDEAELEELRNWKPNGEIGFIYKQHYG